MALMAVPLLWGTFTPSMKLLLDREHAPPVVLTNLLSHSVGMLALSCMWLCEAPPRCHCVPESSGAQRPTITRIVTASCELGVYLFFGQLTQMLGLDGTSATTNAILVQSSVVLVPIIDEARSAMPLVGRLHRLLPSLLALIGIATTTAASTLTESSLNQPSNSPTSQDPGYGASAGADNGSTFGVVCSLASAGFYALHTLRLSEYGDVHATLQATGQVAVNAALDFLTLPTAALLDGTSGTTACWWRRAHHIDQDSFRRLSAAAVWNGIFIVGATTWGMSFAQRSFRASTAAVAYAMEPLFAAIFAAGMLHESLTPLTIAGGVLIIAANVLVGLRAHSR